MTSWPVRTWTRAPAPGTRPSSQVAAADHAPPRADRVIAGVGVSPAVTSAPMISAQAPTSQGPARDLGMRLRLVATERMADASRIRVGALRGAGRAGPRVYQPIV